MILEGTIVESAHGMECISWSIAIFIDEEDVWLHFVESIDPIQVTNTLGWRRWNQG